MDGRKRLIGLVCAGLLLFMACAPAAAPTSTAAPLPTATPLPPIKLGATFGLTGVFAYSEQWLLEGMQVAVDQANTAGGVLGRKLEVVALNNKSVVSDGIETLRDLIYNYKVDFVRTGASSAVCMAQSQIALEAKVPLFADCMTDAFTYTKGNRYAFRAHLNSWQQGTAGAEYVVAKYPNATRFYTIATDFEWGHALTDRFVARLKEIKPGAQVVGQTWPKLGETEYQSYLTAILSAQPDVLVVTIAPGPSFFTQAMAMGVLGKMGIVSPGWWIDHVVRMEKADMPASAHIGGILWYEIQNPLNNAFVQAMRDRFKREPVTHHYLSYLNTLFLIEGIRKAGSTDREKVIAALEGLTLDTVVGRVTLGDYSHQGQIPYWVGEIAWDAGKGYAVLAKPTAFQGTKTMPSEAEVRSMREKTK